MEKKIQEGDSYAFKNLALFFCCSDKFFLDLAREKGLTVNEVIGKLIRSPSLREDSKHIVKHLILMVRKANLQPEIAWDFIKNNGDFPQICTFGSTLVRMCQQTPSFRSVDTSNLIREVHDLIVVMETIRE